MPLQSATYRIFLVISWAVGLAAVRTAEAQAQAPTSAPELASAAGDGAGSAMPAVLRTQPVAAREIGRGSVLTEEDIRYAPVPEREESWQEAPANLVGWKVRRLIREGEPLRPPAVSPPELVRAGEPVEVLYRGRSVVVRVKGTAAGSGTMGERVLVRVDAHRRLEGVVIGPALVELESNERR
ncbi:MAG TPA: flagellar basal body P-ring formation chaperone FlgA [Longimicrobiaceae bacterium]